MYYGLNHQDIKYLQMLLNSDPDTMLNATAGLWGSSGKETIHFGKLTYDAVARFQEKYASEILYPTYQKGTGNVGPATRNKLNQLLGR